MDPREIVEQRRGRVFLLSKAFVLSLFRAHHERGRGDLLSIPTYDVDAPEDAFAGDIEFLPDQGLFKVLVYSAEFDPVPEGSRWLVMGSCTVHAKGVVL